MENLLKNKKHPGFSLLEVMVAMAIMAITFMAVLDSQSVSISGASEAKFSTTAALLAQKKMAELQILGAGDISSDSGDFGDDHPGYSWELTVEDPSFDAPENVTNHLKQLDLKVSWGDMDSASVVYERISENSTVISPYL